MAAEHSQSLGEFRQNAAETLDRLNRTGEAEVITVDGQARAVLLSPAAYEQIVSDALLAHDVATIRRSMKEIDEGRGIEAREMFDQLRDRLRAMKESQSAGGSR